MNKKLLQALCIANINADFDTDFYGVECQHYHADYFAALQDEPSQELLCAIWPMLFVKDSWFNEISGVVDEVRLEKIVENNISNTVLKQPAKTPFVQLCDSMRKAFSPDVLEISRSLLDQFSPAVNAPVLHAEPQSMFSKESYSTPAKRLPVQEPSGAQLMSANTSYAQLMGAIKFVARGNPFGAEKLHFRKAAMLDDIVNMQKLGYLPYWWPGKTGRAIKKQDGSNDSKLTNDLVWNDMLIAYYANNTEGTLTAAEFMNQVPEYMRSDLEKVLERKEKFQSYYVLQLHAYLAILSYCVDFDEDIVDDVLAKHAATDNLSDKLVSYMLLQLEYADYRECNDLFAHFEFAESAQHCVENWANIETYLLELLVGSGVKMRDVVLHQNGVRAQASPVKRVRNYNFKQDCAKYGLDNIVTRNIFNLPEQYKLSKQHKCDTLQEYVELNKLKLEQIKDFGKWIKQLKEYKQSADENNDFAKKQDRLFRYIMKVQQTWQINGKIRDQSFKIAGLTRLELDKLYAISKDGTFEGAIEQLLACAPKAVEMFDKDLRSLDNVLTKIVGPDNCDAKAQEHAFAIIELLYKMDDASAK